MASNKAKIITITSVKGGVGKSTLVLNLAGVLSSQKQKTIIVDLDLSSGVIAASLDVANTNDIYSLTDDMMNNRYTNAEKYISSYNEYIDVLACPNDPRNTLKIFPQYIETVLKELKYKYDVILIDTNHVISEINLAAFDESDEILYILTDDLMNLKNMKTLIAIYDDMNVTKYKIILNENIKRLNTFEVKTILGKEIDYTLPKSFYEEDMEKYTENGKIMTIEKPNSKETNILKEIIK